MASSRTPTLLQDDPGPSSVSGASLSQKHNHKQGATATGSESAMTNRSFMSAGSAITPLSDHSMHLPGVIFSSDGEGGVPGAMLSSEGSDGGAPGAMFSSDAEENRAHAEMNKWDQHSEPVPQQPHGGNNNFRSFEDHFEGDVVVNNMMLGPQHQAVAVDFDAGAARNDFEEGGGGTGSAYVHGNSATPDVMLTSSPSATPVSFYESDGGAGSSNQTPFAPAGGASLNQTPFAPQGSITQHNLSVSGAEQDVPEDVVVVQQEQPASNAHNSSNAQPSSGRKSLSSSSSSKKKNSGSGAASSGKTGNSPEEAHGSESADHGMRRSAEHAIRPLSREEEKSLLAPSGATPEMLTLSAEDLMQNPIERLKDPHLKEQQPPRGSSNTNYNAATPAELLLRVSGAGNNPEQDEEGAPGSAESCGSRFTDRPNYMSTKEAQASRAMIEASMNNSSATPAFFAMQEDEKITSSSLIGNGNESRVNYNYGTSSEQNIKLLPTPAGTPALLTLSHAELQEAGMGGEHDVSMLNRSAATPENLSLCDPNLLQQYQTPANVVGGSGGGGSRGCDSVSSRFQAFDDAAASPEISIDVSALSDDEEEKDHKYWESWHKKKKEEDEESVIPTEKDEESEISLSHDDAACDDFLILRLFFVQL